MAATQEADAAAPGLTFEVGDLVKLADMGTGTVRFFGELKASAAQRRPCASAEAGVGLWE